MKTSKHVLFRARAIALTCYSAAFCVLTTGFADAATDIISNGDTYIRSSTGTTNYNSGPAYMVANDNGSNVRMAIFSFDISSVPPGTIASAKLQLDDVIGNASQTYEIWGLLDAHETFDEATLTWNTAGFVDATDNTTVDGSKAYGGVLLGTFSNAANTVNTAFDVTSGPFLDFLNASGDNDVTFVIVDPNSNTAGSGWATKEAGAGDLKPTLTLDAAGPPTLASEDFVDDQSGGPVVQGTLVTYTVTFSEDMDALTVDASDFGNAGSATFSIGSVTETAPGVFSVPVTPTSDGTLQLQVNPGAVLSNPTGSNLDTSTAILDDTTLSVTLTDTTDPTLSSSDIVDDKAGGPVVVGIQVTYTVTFSEDMDDTTVDATDFGVTGTAGVSIGTVTETSPGVFTVPVTANSAGTMRLQINQAAVLSDPAGNDLDTSLAILDDTTIDVLEADPDIIAYYPFDGNFNDSTGNGYDGTLTDVGTTGNSGISTTSGEFKFGGGALDLAAGEADYVVVPTITLAAADVNGWAITFWAKNRSVAGNSGGMIVGDTTDTQDFVWVDSAAATGGGVRLRNTANQNADFGGLGEDAVWHHYALVYEDADGDSAVDDVTLYLDGSPENTINNFAGDLTINGIGQGYNAPWAAFDGQIDELYIFGTAIDAAKVTELYTGVPDETPPTLVGSDITDDRGGASVVQGNLVTYTVTFSEDMDSSTVTAPDFGNAGSALFTIGTVTETSPGVFSVPVTPTGTGSLQLQVNPSAVLSDTSGNNLDTAVAIADDTTITVDPPDSTPPTLAGSDIGDNQGGGTVPAGTTVTFTLTFSEDMDHTTVDAADFGNAGTAGFTIGTITEISPGVFTVEVSPTSSGTLQLSILAFAEMNDASGNPLDTSSAILDETILTIEEGFTPAGVERLRVVLVGGQSNADGRAATSGLPTSPVNLQQPQEDVDFFYRVEGTIFPLTTLRPGLSETGGFGPAITCGRYLADELADGVKTRVAVIKYANGGTNLYSQWAGGGTGTTSGDGSQYVRFQETVTAGLAALASTYPNAVIELVGMVWLQGESDTGSQAVNYEANLTNFIADVRLTYGAELRFVVIRLSSGQTAVGSLATIRAAQTAVAAADPLTGLVDSDGFGMKTDNLHFDAIGQQQNGEASAIQLLNLYPFLSPPVISPQAGGDFQIAVHDPFDGFLYTLERSSDLGPESWEGLETITGSGSVVTFTHTPGEGVTKEFFRVGRSLTP